jgi:hypothetical protein
MVWGGGDPIVLCIITRVATASAWATIVLNHGCLSFLRGREWYCPNRHSRLTDSKSLVLHPDVGLIYYVGLTLLGRAP